jgi:DNA-binding transcriptional MerR regulator/effector-binding domain-containing protein
MIRIGDFARLGRVSAKALRLYDELGLLKPSFVDRFTDYRYYVAEQLPRLNQITGLKSLGLSLDEIGSVFEHEAGGVDVLLASLLRQKLAELDTQFEQERARRERIQTHLSELERKLEGRTDMTNYPVTLKPIASYLVASTRDAVPSMDRLSPALHRMFDQIFGYLTYRHGVKSWGPATVLYHAWDPQIEVEAVIPLNEAVPSAEHVQVYTLPAIECAAVVQHKGPFTTLNKAYESVMGWIEPNGYRIAGPNREVNLVYDAKSDPAGWLTEIQIPVVKR